MKLIFLLCIFMMFFAFNDDAEAKAEANSFEVIQINVIPTNDYNLPIDVLNIDDHYQYSKISSDSGIDQGMNLNDTSYIGNTGDNKQKQLKSGQHYYLNRHRY